MATFTENYSLIKPSEADYYDVQDFNDNMDTIDALMTAAETAVDAVSEKIGTAEDTDTTTVFGKLNAMASSSSGFTAIKSIQRLAFDISTNNSTKDIAINPVVPENCILLIDRLYDGSDFSSPINYTLYADHLSFVTTGSINGALHINVQIIEFC